jgi:hypothetical protein
LSLHGRGPASLPSYHLSSRKRRALKPAVYHCPQVAVVVEVVVVVVGVATAAGVVGVGVGAVEADARERATLEWRMPRLPCQ